MNDAGGTGVQFVVLHTAEDAKTLVRALLVLDQLAIGDGNMDVFWNLAIRPAGTAVTNAIVSRAQSEDVPSPLQEIAGGVSVVKADAANNVFEYPGQQRFDIKAQRKLKEGDTVVFSHLGSAANYQMLGIIYVWFKE